MSDDAARSQSTHDRCDCGGTLQFDDTEGIAHCPDCGSHERYIPRTTVRVRILVAVDHEGKWTATGMSLWSDKEMRDNADIDDLAPGERYSWVEADVPLPPDAGPAIEGVVHAE